MPTKEIVSPPQIQKQSTATNGVHAGKTASHELESEAGHIVSEEVYWADYYEHPAFAYEWNDGKLEVKPVSNYAQFTVYLWFMALLKDYLHVHANARMIGLEMGFRLKLPRKTTIRKPDLAVVLHSNPIPLGDKDRSYRGTFDICIESLSDSAPKEIERDTKVKKLEYAQAGVQEYYILDEERKETIFYQLGKNGIYTPIPMHNGVIESSVLPGFRLRVSDLYTLPQAPEMIDDPIYLPFTSPFVRAERVRAEQAEERARVAEERAAQEQARSAHYAAKLKSLGISLDEP